MRFFFDNCVAPRLAKAINALIEPEDHVAVHLRDKFSPDISDVDWLNALGVEGEWVVVSNDLRITRNKHESAAWLESGLTAFFLSRGWNSIGLWQQATKLVDRWPLIMEQAERVAPGAGFLVKPKGKLEQVRIK